MTETGPANFMSGIVVEGDVAIREIAQPRRDARGIFARQGQLERSGGEARERGRTHDRAVVFEHESRLRIAILQRIDIIGGGVLQETARLVAG